MRLLIVLLCVSTLLSCGERNVVRAEKGSTTSANDAQPCSPEWQDVDDGARYRTAGCRERGDGFELHVVELDPSRWTIDVDAGPRRPMSAAVQSANARFAINANFFDVNDRPLGVVVSSGRVVQGVHPVSWQSIFSVDRDGTPRIRSREQWEKESRKVFAAVQAGPRIVVGGVKNEVAKGDPSLRSGVCITPDRRVRFFVTAEGSYADVHEMVEMAGRSDADGGLGCADAMLFDGGPSAQLHLNTRGKAIDMSGDVVPVYVVAKPRN